jgi:hypothetical protein
MQEDDSLVFKSNKKKIHYYSSEKANHIITDIKYWVRKKLSVEITHLKMGSFKTENLP